MDNVTLATEMLHEIKAQSKRWFIISIILLVALVGSSVAWLIHENSYETITTDESTTVDGDNGIATYLENSNSGDINYGKDN